MSKGTANWYMTIDKHGFEDLYQAAIIGTKGQFPSKVIAFETKADRADRKRLQKTIEALSGNKRLNYDTKYVAMCRKVAQESANIFNSNFANGMKSKRQSSIVEIIMKYLFRINAVGYILTGTDLGTSFAVRVPALGEWKRRWRLNGITAMNDPERSQSVVDFVVRVEKIKTKAETSLRFHSENRWSHGKFCGNPEAKLYKEFTWKEVPFFEKIF